MDPDPLASQIAEVASHANFGLPAGLRGKLGPIRRVLARILAPQIRQQIEFNQRVVGVLNDVGALLAFYRKAYENFEQAFDNVDHAFLDAHKREVLLDERLELVQRQGFVRYEQAVGHLQSDFAEAISRIEDETRAWREETRAWQEVDKKVAAFESRFEGDIRQHFADARMRFAEVDVFLNAVKRSFPQMPSAERLRELPGAFARLYPSFEEVLRGPESEIKERARSYLPDVLEVKDLGPVLDLGPGRCEWLSLLRDEGIEAFGVEINDLYVAKALERGFDVRPGDAIEYLKGLSEGELGAVTAFHLVEHIDVDSLIELLDLALRALRPGGLLILETPDPENLIVGASNFYLDPTHRHPLPPPLLSFLVRSRGFTGVEVREMKREARIDDAIDADSPWAEDLGRMWDFVRSRIAGPEDYAVLAHRL